MMRLSQYEELHKDKIEFTIQRRFADSIQRLNGLGFREEFYIRESWFPMSALVMSPMMMALYFMGEIVRIEGLMQAAIFNPFIVHEDGFAYAEVMTQGVNYITLFDDSTILKTPTHNPGQTGRPDDRYIVQVGIHNPALTFDTAWRQHVWRVKKLMGDGRSPITPLTVKHIMRYEAQIDRLAIGFQRSKLPTESPNYAKRKGSEP